MPAPLPPDAAIFLDIDGTLLDIAEQPHLVVIPPGLPETLARLRATHGGALAFISGRPLHEIDQFFPGDFPAAAEHGAVVRDATGKIHRTTTRPKAYDHWLKTLQELADRTPGLFIEQKTVGLVAHYRQAPQSGPIVYTNCQNLIAESPDSVLLQAHMAYELRAKGAAKDTALAWFLTQPPFAGRPPVFIGDDTTDEPAIAYANRHNGIGLHTNRDFTGPGAVRAWLGAG